MKKTLLRNLIIAILVIIIIFSTMTRTYAIGVINSVELADLSLSNSADDKSSNIGSSTATSLLAGLEEASSDLKNMVSITSNGYELQGNYALRIIQALEKASVDSRSSHPGRFLYRICRPVEPGYERLAVRE